jgi:putative hydrolase of the HAD superfamily
MLKTSNIGFPLMLDWPKISTVLLDMDGTLLDLHFDNYFWLVHLPKTLSKAKNLPEEQARQQLQAHYEKVSGTIAWYCLDYWAEQTGLDIVALKREVQHLIQLRDDAHDFLIALCESGREIVLVTNAHPQSLALKIERTALDQYFDTLYSTHEFGATKESQVLWQRLQQHHGFDNETTLFVDDSLPILQSAHRFGIQHLLAVTNPDSQKPANKITQFPATDDYRTLIADITAHPITR